MASCAAREVSPHDERCSWRGGQHRITAKGEGFVGAARHQPTESRSNPRDDCRHNPRADPWYGHRQNDCS